MSLSCAADCTMIDLCAEFIVTIAEILNCYNNLFVIYGNNSPIVAVLTERWKQ